MPRWKRANGAIKDIRKYLAKHMKTEDVKLDKTINEKVWSRGPRNRHQRSVSAP